MSTNSATDIMLFTITSGNVYAVGGNLFASNVAGAAISAPAGHGVFAVVTDTDGATSQIIATGAGAYFGFSSTVPIASVAFRVALLDGSPQTTATWSTVDNFVMGTTPIIGSE